MHSTKKIAKMGILAALSVVLVFLIHFPIIPAASFLEYDPADVPILLGTFAMGPVCGVILAIVAATIQGLTVSAASGWYGIIMHIIATCTYVVVAGCIYNAKKSKKTALIALICGTLAMAAIMVPANLLITPAYSGMPRSSVAELIIPAIIPFNLIKAGINSLITFLLYKKLSPLLHK